MRFDSIEHLQTWRNTGAFPAIHDNIFAAVSSRSKGRSFCDLGACQGLLTQRLLGIAGASAFGVEANPTSIDQAGEFGIKPKLYHLRVTRKTLGLLGAYLEDNKADVIVARRVMPELWGEDLPGGKYFASFLRSCGINEIFLEGRVKTPNAVNALSSIEAEIELLSADYETTWHDGAIAHLSSR